MKEPRAGDESILTAVVTLVLVIVSARSGEYAPGPIDSLVFVARLTPIVNDLVSVPKALPSSYYPGATSAPPGLANVDGLAGDDAILIVLVVLVLVRDSALSGSYVPGPMVSTTLSVRFSPIVNDFACEPNS